MSERTTDLCSVDELQPGIVHGVALAPGRHVGVVLVGDRVHVFAGSCPHHGGPLTRGRVHASVFSDCPGVIVADHTRPVLTCPWHNWEFDLQTGHALRDRRRRLRVYAAEVVDGRVIARTRP